SNPSGRVVTLRIHELRLVARCPKEAAVYTHKNGRRERNKIVELNLQGRPPVGRDSGQLCGDIRRENPWTFSEIEGLGIVPPRRLSGNCAPQNRPRHPEFNWLAVSIRQQLGHSRASHTRSSNTIHLAELAILSVSISVHEQYKRVVHAQIGDERAA